MKIGFFCYSLSGAGPRVRARNLISALADRMSNRPVLVTRKKSSFTDTDVEVNRILSRRSLLNPKVIFQIKKSFKDCDVIHVPVNFYQLAYAAAIGLSPRVAGAGIQHERRFRVLTRLIGVEMMIETHELSSQLWSNSGVESEYIYPAVDTDLFSPTPSDQTQNLRSRLGIHPDDDVLLFVGKLKPLKGAELMHDVAHQFSDEDVTTVVVGDGEQRQLFENCNKVVFEGFVKNEKLPEYYRTADITIVPSQYESFSIVSLESIASGTPVITTTGESCDMYRIFNERGTYIWTDRSVAGITQAVENLLNNTNKYQEQVNTGFQTISKLDLSTKNAVENYIQIYESVYSSQ
jgi:glycosyltransferase involved in cell wall biosynthesis